MTASFVQIHFLTAYPAALLNRDDAGFAKRMPFGGVVRTRVSSQCMKRHWRVFEGRGSLAELNLPNTVRSRETFERQIVQPLVAAGGDLDTVRAVTEALKNQIFGQSEKAKAKKKEGSEPVTTEQVTVLGKPEVDYFKRVVEQALPAVQSGAKPEDAVVAALGKDLKKNLRALAHASGLGAAMFGRMVTSDILARGDAAVHVAHAFTVHGQESEPDYFSAIDDLVKDDGALGSGHIGTTELTSGLFYGYVVVDLPLLVSNLSGCERGQWAQQDRGLAGEVVARLVQLVATVSPGAKLGSTAPYAYAQGLLVEVGDAQPRTLANAFLQPVPAKGEVLPKALEMLSGHLAEMDRLYETGEERRAVGVGLSADQLGKMRAGDGGSVPALARWVAEQVAR